MGSFALTRVVVSFSMEMPWTKIFTCARGVNIPCLLGMVWDFELFLQQIALCRLCSNVRMAYDVPIRPSPAIRFFQG